MPVSNPKKNGHILTLNFEPIEYEVLREISKNDIENYVARCVQLSIAQAVDAVRKQRAEKQAREERERFLRSLSILCLEMPNHVNDCLLGTGIKTIDDLLEYSYGLFTRVSGIGAKYHKSITKKLTEMGLDLSGYIGQVFAGKKVPVQLWTLFQKRQIRTIHDIKILNKSTIYEGCAHDYLLTERIVALFREVGIELPESPEPLTLDIPGLDQRTRNLLVRRGWHYQSQCLLITPEVLMRLPGVGRKCYEEIISWQEAKRRGQ